MEIYLEKEDAYENQQHHNHRIPHSPGPGGSRLCQGQEHACMSKGHLQCSPVQHIYYHRAGLFQRQSDGAANV